MQKCPECGALNTRRSRHRVSKKTPHTPFAAWFRCRECRARFQATDWALAGRWAVMGVLLAGLAAVALWAGSSPAPSPETHASNPLPEHSTAPALESLPEGALVLPASALRVGAEGGDRETQYRLGIALFQEHQKQGGQSTLDEAVRWLREAGAQGHTRAQLKLGVMYEGGLGVIQDYAEALRWFRGAAKQGQAEAMLRLGAMYQNGRGVAKDLVTAYVWLNLAAARGETDAEVPRNQVRILIPDGALTDAQSRSRLLDEEIPRL